jgi:TPR repeat protein
VQWDNEIKMNDKKSNIQLSEDQAKQIFHEGYELAFGTKKRIKPWAKIFDLWKLAATAGYIRAQFYLGTCYDFGNGVERDIKKAYYWYMKAAKKGKMEAQYNIGFFYKQGELVKQDYKKAVYWYSLAAEQGDIEAQRDLGYCYFYGEGVKQDHAKAIYWYKKSASQGDGKANYNLGLCFEYGDGVRQSIRWANIITQKQANLETVKRQIN